MSVHSKILYPNHRPGLPIKKNCLSGYLSHAGPMCKGGGGVDHVCCIEGTVQLLTMLH